MLQCSNISPLRVRPLLRLLQLLRISDEHQIPGGPRDREGLHERNLTCLVDKKIVQAVSRVVSRPQPRRAADDMSIIGSRKGRVVRSHIAGTVIDRLGTLANFVHELN